MAGGRYRAISFARRSTQLPPGGRNDGARAPGRMRPRTRTTTGERTWRHTTPTTDELRALVATQLRQHGVDISVLPPGGPGQPTSDPATGSPTQYALITSVVATITGSVSYVAGYKVDDGYKQN